MMRETTSIPMFAITPGEEEAGSCYRAHIHAAAVVIVIAIVVFGQIRGVQL